jgi:hypothetical protein
MLTDVVNRMLKFDQMMDGKFLRSSSDDDKWLVCGKFGSAVLTGAYKAHLIGADSFSDEVDHIDVVMYMWANELHLDEQYRSCHY